MAFKSKFYLLFLFLLLIHSTRLSFTQTAQNFQELPYGQELQRVLDDGIQTANGTGVSAAVITKEDRTWGGSAGMSNAVESERINSDMLFVICSIGKNYVASLTLKLVEEGLLSLEDPIQKWLPNYPNINNTIRIHQLLNHTSGIFDYVKHPRSPYQKPYSSIEFTRLWETETILKELVAEPYFQPGEDWHYSTTNYLLLRMIIEKVGGTDLSEMLRTRFFTPLALKNTVAVDRIEPVPQKFKVAHKWFDTDGDDALNDLSRQSRNWHSIVPHLIYSNASDLARWSQSLFQGKVLKPNTLEKMLEFHRPTPDEPYSGYGLGAGEFPRELFEGEQAWGHAGRDYGWTAVMVYFPRLETSIAVLINDNNMDCLFYVGRGLLKVIKKDLEMDSTNDSDNLVRQMFTKFPGSSGLFLNRP
jgi:D-alanyl-D-alanine carboxypeptidase